MPILHLPSAISDGVNRYRMKGLLLKEAPVLLFRLRESQCVTVPARLLLRPDMASFGTVKRKFVNFQNFQVDSVATLTFKNEGTSFYLFSMFDQFVR